MKIFRTIILILIYISLTSIIIGGFLSFFIGSNFLAMFGITLLIGLMYIFMLISIIKSKDKELFDTWYKKLFYIIIWTLFFVAGIYGWDQQDPSQRNYDYP